MPGETEHLLAINGLSAKETGLKTAQSQRPQRDPEKIRAQIEPLAERLRFVQAEIAAFQHDPQAQPEKIRGLIRERDELRRQILRIQRDDAAKNSNITFDAPRMPPKPKDFLGVGDFEPRGDSFFGWFGEYYRWKFRLQLAFWQWIFGLIVRFGRWLLGKDR